MNQEQKNSAQLVSETVGGEIYEYYPLGEYVVRAIGVCGGRPTFKYTRIEVAGTLDRLAAGETVEQLVEGYCARVPYSAFAEAINLVTNNFINPLPVLERPEVFCHS